jgi:membrane associated rhomboid family serine protease
MIPLKDENRTETFPFVTTLIIIANSLVFMLELVSPLDISVLAQQYGAVPFNLISFTRTLEAPQPINPLTTVFAAMFMHGNFIHLAGNMLYLWIFGDNVEDMLGHVRFFFFYIFSGIVATYTFALTGPDSLVPMVGASGAISGVLGAYIMLFPSARVTTLIFFGFFWIMKIRALLVIGYWAFFQVLNGILSATTIQQGGIAWLAHVGGFIAGLSSVRLWLPGKRYTRF